jgi:nitric oxide reductase activation protein
MDDVINSVLDSKKESSRMSELLTKALHERAEKKGEKWREEKDPRRKDKYITDEQRTLEGIDVRLGTLSEYLANELRPIFKIKRARRREARFKTGGDIGIVKRISELANNINAFDSRAWEKRSKATDLDYVFTLLVDMSGSMSGAKAYNAFLGAACVGEALQKLAIPVNITSFTDRLILYKDFREVLLREKYIEMWKIMEAELHSQHSSYNSDGWAIHNVTKKLKNQTGKLKYLLVFSDGRPVNAPKHRSWRLPDEIKRTAHKLRTRPIGIGIGKDGCDSVKHYYKDHILCPDITSFPHKVVQVVKAIVEKPNIPADKCKLM